MNESPPNEREQIQWLIDRNEALERVAEAARRLEHLNWELREAFKELDKLSQ